MFRVQGPEYQTAIVRVFLFTTAMLLVLTGSSVAEDMNKKATALLTRAADASTYEKGQQPSFHEAVRFVVHVNDGEAEGQYSRDFADPKEQREELVIGSFRELWVWRDGQIWNRKEGEFDSSTIEMLRTSLPPRRVLELLPFDKVNKIEAQEVNGVKAQCISFDRTVGQHQSANMACVEQERGVLLLWSRGKLTTEYSEYAQFASKLLPRHVVISKNQAKLLDAHINLVEMKEFSADKFVPPSDAKPETVVQACTQIAGPTLKTGYAPSYPSDARARGVVGVVTIVAVIGKDGLVHNAHVAQPGDSELDNAAIDAVQHWVYTPGTCNGSPVAVQTTITVKFETH